MKYLKDEISLLQTVKDEFKTEIQDAMANILDSYNKIYIIAVHQQQYINRKRQEYLNEMKENFRLIEKNRSLEESINQVKNLNEVQNTHLKELEKKLRMTKKLLKTYQNDVNNINRS